ncbi:helix-turn-helix domain-containing protein [Actinomadura parmotrematis]|uniref:Helix-turn-helix transcriptional regulator n=1 Tax=Actinomadura parmotrematis TaxID=2864039 RepID=A0ABS7FYM1_9ACTN|nr:helix-turn-helix transcriptional regulator [Actinomadura parmotrematis]MBW8485538.1 helix-turn-helix transcriptional regulator [Actinomadura parmotrematis]
MPIVREPLDPKISMWHFLAFYLRFLREKEGLSLAQCGKIINVARSTVSNMEAGRQRPHQDQMQKLDAAYGTGLLFQLLLWYARMAHDPDWGRQFIHYEEQASLIRLFHGQVIPLVFQTDAYTWECVRAGTSKDREMAMARRLARKQQVLGRGDDVDIWVLIDEAALARPVGGGKLMKQQVEHLLELAQKENVSLRIVPFSSGAHLGVDGSFELVRVGDREIGYSGAQNGGRVIESPGEVRVLADLFDRIGAKASSEGESRNILKQYAERY